MNQGKKLSNHGKKQCHHGKKKSNHGKKRKAQPRFLTGRRDILSEVLNGRSKLLPEEAKYYVVWHPESRVSL
jgi:hypothetical protein